MNASRFSSLVRDMAKTPSRVAGKIAKDVSEEIQRNFDRGLDFDRKPWRKLAKSTLERGRHPPPLTDSHTGRNSIEVSATSGAGIKITVGEKYMMFHQFGGASHLRGKGRTERQRYQNRKQHPDFGRDRDRSSGRMHPPQRAFLPFDKMPRAWAAIVQHRYEEALQGAIK